MAAARAAQQAAALATAVQAAVAAAVPAAQMAEPAEAAAQVGPVAERLAGGMIYAEQLHPDIVVIRVVVAFRFHAF